MIAQNDSASEAGKGIDAEGFAELEQINPSAFLHEQEGLRLLANYLDDAGPYHVWANVEFVGTDGSINDVDALVLTPQRPVRAGVEALGGRDHRRR